MFQYLCYTVNPMSTVAIIGAGMMGSAMCWPLSDRQHRVYLVGTPLDRSIIAGLRQTGVHATLQRPLPPGVQVLDHTEIPYAIHHADWVINGVSSLGIPWFSTTVGPHLSAGQIILSVTKGLEDVEDGSLITIPESIRRRLPASLASIRINAIGGPCIAHELAARRQTGVVFTGEEEAPLARLKGELMTDYYHVWISTDVIGVEFCSALKNAYAMGVGLAVGMMESAGADGLAHMVNPQSMLFAQGIYEIRNMLQLVKAGKDSLFWLPGPGDLFVTVFGGRTVKLGRLLGQGVPFQEASQILSGVTLESVEIITRVARALVKMEERGLARCSDFPLLFHLNEIIQCGVAVDIPWRLFFQNNYG